MKHKDEYTLINESLIRLENGKYAPHSLDWCSNRIDWAWKWRKINSIQMQELANRVIALYDDLKI